MIAPINPTNGIAVGGVNSGNLIAGSEEALNQVNSALFQQGNGEHFVFNLPQPVQDVASAGGIGEPSLTLGANQPTTFGHLAQDLVRSVNNYQQVAGEKVRDVLMGGKTTVPEAMVAVQESGVAFSLLSEVRNKLIDSYQELNRMQI